MKQSALEKHWQECSDEEITPIPALIAIVILVVFIGCLLSWVITGPAEMSAEGEQIVAEALK